VGFRRWERPTVNHRTIDRGYLLAQNQVQINALADSHYKMWDSGSTYKQEEALAAVARAYSVDLANALIAADRDKQPGFVLSPGHTEDIMALAGQKWADVGFQDRYLYTLCTVLESYQKQQPSQKKAEK